MLHILPIWLHGYLLRPTEDSLQYIREPHWWQPGKAVSEWKLMFSQSPSSVFHSQWAPQRLSFPIYCWNKFRSHYEIFFSNIIQTVKNISQFQLEMMMLRGPHILPTSQSGPVSQIPTPVSSHHNNESKLLKTENQSCQPVACLKPSKN